MPRLLANALAEATREIRRDLRDGATWADAHLVSTGDHVATVIVDSSIGFDAERHPRRRKSPRPPTTIFTEARAARG